MESFTDLDSTVSEPQRQEWGQQERDAQARRILDPSAMDIYDLRLPKGICTFSCPVTFVISKIEPREKYICC